MVLGLPYKEGRQDYSQIGTQVPLSPKFPIILNFLTSISKSHQTSLKVKKQRRNLQNF